MSHQDEFEQEFYDDQCIVLPSNYLSSAEAVSEIYEDRLAAATSDLDIEQFREPGFFKGCLLAALLWVLPGLWTICL